MAKKIFLLTEEQKFDMGNFLRNVGPDFKFTESISQSDLLMVVGEDAEKMYSQQIMLAGKLQKEIVMAQDEKSAMGKIRACNDCPGNRDMEFSHSIGYER